MRNKKIKYFNKHFMPMKVPIVTGIDIIDNIDDSLFPLHVAPFVGGTTVLIRHGVAVLESGRIVTNTDFKQRFKYLFEASRKHNYTVHCIFSLGGLYEDGIRELMILTSQCSLPEEAKLYVDDLVIDCYSKKMIVQSRIGLMVGLKYCYRNGNDIIFNMPIFVSNFKELCHTVEIFEASSIPGVLNGVTILKDRGIYTEGITEDILSVDFKIFQYFQIVDVKSALKTGIGGYPITLADSLIVRDGKRIFSMSVTGKNEEFRTWLWSKRETISDHIAVVVSFQSPTSEKPKILGLLEVI
jgi:hypothetical protein